MNRNVRESASADPLVIPCHAGAQHAVACVARQRVAGDAEARTPLAA